MKSFAMELIGLIFDPLDSFQQPLSDIVILAFFSGLFVQLFHFLLHFVEHLLGYWPGFSFKA